mmetsp:Transcript_4109/g.9573  ORF Transcript_4109/g.9573 Transcript_4109/m.9573 type:complete len:227 (+) Transcript_4109:375-1055(+)
MANAGVFPKLGALLLLLPSLDVDRLIRSVCVVVGLVGAPVFFFLMGLLMVLLPLRPTIMSGLKDVMVVLRLSGVLGALFLGEVRGGAVLAAPPVLRGAVRGGLAITVVLLDGGMVLLLFLLFATVPKAFPTTFPNEADPKGCHMVVAMAELATSSLSPLVMLPEKSTRAILLPRFSGRPLGDKFLLLLGSSACVVLEAVVGAAVVAVVVLVVLLTTSIEAGGFKAK